MSGCASSGSTSRVTKSARKLRRSASSQQMRSPRHTCSDFQSDVALAGARARLGEDRRARRRPGRPRRAATAAVPSVEPSSIDDDLVDESSGSTSRRGSPRRWRRSSLPRRVPGGRPRRCSAASFAPQVHGEVTGRRAATGRVSGAVQRCYIVRIRAHPERPRDRPDDAAATSDRPPGNRTGSEPGANA